jgi:hypothetical protein
VIYDPTKRSAEFTGHVEIRDGTRTITANELKVSFSADGAIQNQTPQQAGKPAAPPSGKTLEEAKAKAELLKARLAETSDRVTELADKVAEERRKQPRPRGAEEPVNAARANAEAGDEFVAVYMAMIKGEKLEQAGDLKAALEIMKQAAGRLDKLSVDYPDWQPQIVKFRKDKISAAIQKLQERLK